MIFDNISREDPNERIIDKKKHFITMLDKLAKSIFINNSTSEQQKLANRIGSLLKPSFLKKIKDAHYFAINQEDLEIRVNDILMASV